MSQVEAGQRMRHGVACVLVTLSLSCAASGLVLPAGATTLPSIHGLGTIAVPGGPTALSENPALLATQERSVLATTLHSAAQFDAVSAEWMLPTLEAGQWGFALQRLRDRERSDTWQQRLRLGTAGTVGRRWSIGAGLDLWNPDRQHDFSTRAGLLFDASRLGAATRVHVAAVVRNLFEAAEAAPHPIPGDRVVDVATMAQHPFGDVWMLTASTGLRLGQERRRQASVAAVLRWRSSLECGLGWQEGHARLALGWSQQAWSVGWSLRDDPAGSAQELAIGWSWGPSLAQRQHARAERQRIAIQAQVESAVQEFETAQLEEWKRFAREAFDGGALDRAASFYGMVLTSAPDDAEAQEGFKRSRHAGFVAQADTLMQHMDYGGAARALEEALQITPSDSTSAVRLREVRRAARLAFRQQSDAEQLFRKGIDAFASQQYLQAISAFRGVLALDPEHHMASSYLAQAEQSHHNHVESSLRSARQRLHGEDFDGARKIVRRILDDEPDHAAALQLLTRVDEHQKQAAARDREAERRRLAAEKERQATDEASVEDAAPTPPSPEVLARYEEGIRLYRTGDMMAAMQAWEEVAAQAPHHQDVDSYLLRVYRVAGLERYTEGRLQEAVDIWQKALQLDPENRQLSRYLNQAQTKLKRAHRAGGNG